MLFYASGWQASRAAREERLIKESGLTHRCFSFANLFKIEGFPYFISGFQGSYDVCRKHKVGIMFDSGVVSYRTHLAYLKRNGKVNKLPDGMEFARLYAEYCKLHNKEWDWYATVDMVRSAPKIFEWHAKVCAMGVSPTPVFHGDAGLDWIKKYYDLGNRFIALGTHSSLRSGNRDMRMYLDSVFNLGAKLGIEYHGLAMTAPWMMLEFPWRAVDSSWWTRTAGYGSIMRFDAQAGRMCIAHVSDRISKASAGKAEHFKRNDVAMQRLREELKFDGFDLEELKEDFTARHIVNAKEMMKLTAEATRRHKSGWTLLL